MLLELLTRVTTLTRTGREGEDPVDACDADELSDTAEEFTTPWADDDSSVCCEVGTPDLRVGVPSVARREETRGI